MEAVFLHSWTRGRVRSPLEQRWPPPSRSPQNQGAAALYQINRDPQEAQSSCAVCFLFWCVNSNPHVSFLFLRKKKMQPHIQQCTGHWWFLQCYFLLISLVYCRMKRREASLSGPKAVFPFLLVNCELHSPVCLSLSLCHVVELQGLALEKRHILPTAGERSAVSVRREYPPFSCSCKKYRRFLCIKHFGT